MHFTFESATLFNEQNAVFEKAYSELNVHLKVINDEIAKEVGPISTNPGRIEKLDSLKKERERLINFDNCAPELVSVQKIHAYSTEAQRAIKQAHNFNAMIEV